MKTMIVVMAVVVAATAIAQQTNTLDIKTEKDRAAFMLADAQTKLPVKAVAAKPETVQQSIPKQAQRSVFERGTATFRVLEGGKVKDLKKGCVLYTDRDYTMKERPMQLASTSYVMAPFSGCEVVCEKEGVAFALGLFDPYNQGQTDTARSYLEKNDWTRMEDIPAFVLFYMNGADRPGGVYWKEIKKGEGLSFPAGMVLVFLAGNCAAKADETNTPMRMTMEFNDGSVLYGIPSFQVIPIQVRGQWKDLPLSQVRSINLGADHETATLTLWDGSGITGVPRSDELHVQTELGHIPLPIASAKRIALSLGGKRLEKTSYKKASGSQWFLGGIGADVPKRILGKEYKPAAFLMAHAPGRIEYEFTTPITEFYAHIALTDEYGGTKGNVIFMVETEQGIVYTSPAIRHFQEVEVYVRFKPTKKIVLVTDPNGGDEEDWSVWVNPEVR